MNNNGKLIGKLIVLALTITISFCSCTNSDKARQAMRNESEDNYGVMRTVTAYGITGEKIGEWHGKIDVQYVYDGMNAGQNPRVDLVVFDGSDPVDRIIISNAIVVVDND